MAGSRRLRWIGLVLLGLAAAAAVFAARWILDPETARAYAETGLSRALGQPVAIGAMRVSLLPAPAVVGTDIRIGDPAQTAPAIHLQAIRIVPRVRTLFRRPVAVEDVRLDGLMVSALRDREGGWHLPPIAPPPAADAGAFVIEHVSVRNASLRIFEDGPDGLREAAAIDTIDAAVRTGDGGVRLDPLTARIGGAPVAGRAAMDGRGARLEVRIDPILDEDLAALAALAGTGVPDLLRLPAPAAVEVSVHAAPGKLEAAGTFDGSAVRVDSLALDGLRTPFRFTTQRLTLDPASFTLYGGSHQGTIGLDLSQAPVGWRADSRLENLDAAAFLDALTGGSQPLEGRATVTAGVAGRVGVPLERSLEGQARIEVMEGALREFPLLDALNQALRAGGRGPRDTRFDRLSATVALGGGQARTDDLLLEGRDVRVPAAGRLGFDGSLDFTARAIFTAEYSAELIRSVRELSALRNARGEVELPFTLDGTLGHPSFRIDVAAALREGAGREIRRRLEDLIRPRRPDR